MKEKKYNDPRPPPCRSRGRGRPAGEAGVRPVALGVTDAKGVRCKEDGVPGRVRVLGWAALAFPSICCMVRLVGFAFNCFNLSGMSVGKPCKVRLDRLQPQDKGALASSSGGAIHFLQPHRPRARGGRQNGNCCFPPCHEDVVSGTGPAVYLPHRD